MQRAVVTLPAWLLTALGLACVAGLALIAGGIVSSPGWPALGRSAVSDEASVQRAAQKAEARMREAARLVYAAKQRAGAFVEAGGSPEGSALIGSELTPLVTTLGSLDAKQLAASPAWAHRLTLELARAGVAAGGVVAASFSGSFPGLNLAVVCATQALGARVLAVSSVTASTWGATDPGFTWPEIEARLAAAHVIAPATIAVTVGGGGDTGLDLDPDARALAESIADRAAGSLGAIRLRPSSAGEAVTQRIAAIERRSGGRPVDVFVNVGGTMASLGRDDAILRLSTGWLDDAASGDLGDGLLAHYARRHVPVLHLLNIRDLARRWGITP